MRRTITSGTLVNTLATPAMPCDSIIKVGTSRICRFQVAKIHIAQEWAVLESGLWYNYCYCASMTAIYDIIDEYVWIPRGQSSYFKLYHLKTSYMNIQMI